MAQQDALNAIAALRAHLATLPPAEQPAFERLEDLATWSREQGFPVELDDLRNAFEVDWHLRWVRASTR